MKGHKRLRLSRPRTRSLATPDTRRFANQLFNRARTVPQISTNTHDKWTSELGIGMAADIQQPNHEPPCKPPQGSRIRNPASLKTPPSCCTGIAITTTTIQYRPISSLLQGCCKSKARCDHSFILASFCLAFHSFTTLSSLFLLHHVVRPDSGPRRLCPGCCICFETVGYLCELIWKWKPDWD